MYKFFITVPFFKKYTMQYFIITIIIKINGLLLNNTGLKISTHY